MQVFYTKDLENLAEFEKGEYNYTFDEPGWIVPIIKRIVDFSPDYSFGGYVRVDNDDEGNGFDWIMIINNADTIAKESEFKTFVKELFENPECLQPTPTITDVCGAIFIYAPYQV